jgi:hypothetical protein
MSDMDDEDDEDEGEEDDDNRLAEQHMSSDML